MNSNDSPPLQGWFNLMASWSRELLSTVDRIEYLIGNNHQPTNGNYREALLRKLLRRVLPERFRVSTGFIYWGNEKPSRQIDILIWNAQEHAALLEEDELVVLSPNSVEAMIEVKSTLTGLELRDALDLLMTSWPKNWMHASERSSTGIRQNVGNVPFRAVFAYNQKKSKAKSRSKNYFKLINSFYRSYFRDDFDRAIIRRRSRPGLLGQGRLIITLT